MVLGISPMVDYAFKMIFGSPENTRALIGLLNAILQLREPVVEVEIRNPFNRKEFEDGKIVVLDVRCRDAMGRWFSVEMQVWAHRDLLKRLVFYVSGMYVEQAKQGDQYSQLQPAVSICLLKNLLFPQRDQAHHCFQLIDRTSGHSIDDSIEIHTVELPKYNLSVNSIRQANPIDKWAFLLMFAQDFSAEQLQELLPEDEFAGAIRTIEVISAKKEDRQMYDQRSKAQRDYEWGLASVRQEALEEGHEAGRKAGLEQGHEQGLREGVLIGKIQMLQELVNESVSSTQEFEKASAAELELILTKLQQRLRDRAS